MGKAKEVELVECFQLPIKLLSRQKHAVSHAAGRD